MLVKMQLFAAGLPVAAGGKGGKVGIGQGVPVLGKDLPRRKAAGGFCGFQCTLQVGSGGGALGGRCQLGAAQQHAARVHGLGGQQILCLRRKRFRQKGVHNGNDAAQLIPPVQRVVPQDIEKLVHIKDAAGLHHHPVKAAHGHGDEFGAHPALVGVAVAAAADGLHIAAGAQHLLHQHGVHVHRAKVVFQNAHLMSLLYQIPHIAAQKGGLACAQKAGDEIHLNHIFLPPLQKPSQRRSAREGIYFSLFSGAATPG